MTTQDQQPESIGSTRGSRGAWWNLGQTNPGPVQPIGWEVFGTTAPAIGENGPKPSREFTATPPNPSFRQRN
jgi:hypothetical protein